MEPTLTWDIALAKELRHGDAAFTLDVRFASHAHRVVLFGPSGAGKTQTLKLIAGITRPDTGHVQVASRTLFDSERGVNLPAQRRQLGFVFQDYALFPHLTVRQNIAFARRHGWLNPGARRHDEVAERWIRNFHLEPVAGLYPAQLSGGQRQRTALARALAHEPAALLLDEPFAALDQRLRLRLRSELAELLDQVRLPMLLITHDEGDLRALADDVVHLQDGRVTHVETAREVAHA
ncbi:MAG TPA: ATP-binding cassette domain-containing protein [Ideonella sp.]|nr:ATP-binding cassette domain-containing protein [Ideonella sp.]HEX5682845.1 ATP-binding cassette domain-containing protein [Ideonella sp.]